MKKITSLAILLVISLIFAGCAKAVPPTTPPPTPTLPPTSSPEPELPSAVALGTSSIGSAFYVIGVGMADIINKYTDMSATAEVVGGSDANMRAIKEGIVDLALANSFSASNAFRGTQQFAEEGKIPVLLLAVGQPSLRQTVARVASGIETISDLEGKKLVAKRAALAEIEMVADAQLKAFGVSKENVTYIGTAKTGEALDALSSGTVDAAIIPGGVPAATLTQLTETVAIRFLSIPDDKMEVILKELGPAFSAGLIPAGTYKGQDKDVYVPSLSATLVASGDLSEEAAYQITKTLFSHYEELKLVHAAARHWTVENSLQNPPLAFHPGAIRYYKEIGAWLPEHEEKQQNLLK